MKIHLALIIMIAAAFIAIATPFSEFTNWNDLIQRSPDIFIAQRSTIQESVSEKAALHPTVTAVLDGVMPYQIDVVSVLKGDGKTGPSQLYSAYVEGRGVKPHQGDSFLVFASHGINGTNSWYNAVEDYRIVLIARDNNLRAWVHILAGKPLKEQIKIILQYRLGGLSQELKRDQDEKQRMEEGLRELSTNAPSTMPK